MVLKEGLSTIEPWQGARHSHSTRSGAVWQPKMLLRRLSQRASGRTIPEARDGVRESCCSRLRNENKILTITPEFGMIEHAIFKGLRRFGYRTKPALDLIDSAGNRGRQPEPSHVMR